MNQRALFISTCVLSVCVGLTGCGKGGKAGEEPKLDGCPSQAEEVSRLDWGLTESNETAIVTGVIASLELDHAVGTLEQDLTAACSALAKHLSARDKELEPERFELGAEAQKACSVAANKVAQVKATAGGELTITVDAMHCSTRTDVAAGCLNACQSPTKLDCGGELQGDCTGTCTGQCLDPEGGNCNGTCMGNCSGSCDSEFDGVCRGKCEGSCNGQPSKDTCDGTCQGRCMESARGTCGGMCSGSCQGTCGVQADGECNGICAGECDAGMKNQSCVGRLSVPSAANACAQFCEAEVFQAIECEAPRVTVKIENPADENAAEILRSALAERLPDLLRTKALSVDGDRLFALSEASQKAVEAMKTAVQSARKDEKATLTDKASSCISEQAKHQAAAMAGLPMLMMAVDRAREISAAE